MAEIHNHNNNSSLGLYIAADVVKGSPTVGGLVINPVFALIQKDAESLLSLKLTSVTGAVNLSKSRLPHL